MIVPSAEVSRVSKPLIAVAFAETPVVGLLTVVSKFVMSELCVVIVPSAEVTLVSSPEIAEALAETPVVGLLTVFSKAVMSDD